MNKKQLLLNLRNILKFATKKYQKKVPRISSYLNTLYSATKQVSFISRKRYYVLIFCRNIKARSF